MSTKRRSSFHIRPAFSLVEMLLIVAIIGVLVSLLLPALSGARDSALNVKTSSMVADMSNAAQRFANDNAGRNPGYFSENLMGSINNWNSAGDAGIGMSAMENAMLELGGTAVILARSDDPDAPDINPEEGIIELGPDTDPANRVIVNINLIGAEGAYFTPDTNSFIAQEHGTTTVAQAGDLANMGQGQERMPDILDAWGNPMLAWSQDQSAHGSILVEPGASEAAVYQQFAQSNSEAGPAWFYLASNAAFLQAAAFGPASVNMAGDPALGATSSIGGGIPDDLERLHTLATVLASPSSYIVDPSVNGLSDATFEQVFPQRPRGRFMIHSAGSDGIFLSSGDSGWRSNAHTDGTEFHLDFGNNYMDQSGERYTDTNGAFTNTDMLDDFDDILVGTK